MCNPLIMSLYTIGGGKVFLLTNEICIGWGPKPKLDNELEAQPKGYQCRFGEFALFYALGLGWD